MLCKLETPLAPASRFVFGGARYDFFEQAHGPLLYQHDTRVTEDLEVHVYYKTSMSMMILILMAILPLGRRVAQDSEYGVE